MKNKIKSILKDVNRIKKQLEEMLKEEGQEIKEKREVQEEEFNPNEYIQKMLQHNSRHIQIIAQYFISSKQSFPTKKSIQAEIKRWTRDASIIAEYDNNKLTNTFSYVVEKFPEEWNLSTIRKYISRI